MRWVVEFLLIISVAVCTYAGQPVTKSLSVKNEGYYKAGAKYPQFQERTRLAREVNNAIVKWARKEQRRFVNACKKTFENLGKPITPYEYKADYVVMYSDSSRLISIQFEVYEYTGGAHGNFAYTVFNMGWVKGKAKLLKLADFFAADTTYRKHLAVTLLEKLKEDDRAAFARDGSVTSLTNDQLELFVVQPDGLLFLFNRYDVGPWSSGAIQVKLTVEELGEGFRAGMVK